MFKKTMALLAVVTLFGAAACNESITGVEETGAVNEGSSSGSDGKHDEIVPAKNCLVDLRAVEFAYPSETTLIFEGEQLFLSWVAEFPCGDFTADVQVSYDGGRTWHMIAQDLKNAYSLRWTVPNLDGQVPTFRVLATDTLGELEDSVQLASPIMRNPDTSHDNRIPQERD